MSSLGLRRLAVSRAPACIRWLHTRRELPYNIEEGLGKFLPPDALRTVAVDYQSGLLERLNNEVKGTADSRTSVVQTIINTSSKKKSTLAFNYASLALNNSFFLDQLKPPPPAPAVNHQNEISSELLSEIRSDYGDIGGLKAAFSASAMGMFTNGWIWCVTDGAGFVGIVPTFGPGTLLIRSRSYLAYGDDKYVIGEDLSRYTIGFGNDYNLTGDVNENNEIDRDEDEITADLIRRYDIGEDNDDIPGFDEPTRSPTAKPSPPGVSPSSPASGVSGQNNTPKPPSSLHPRFYHSSLVRKDSMLEGTPSGIHSSQPASHHNSTPRNTKAAMLNLGDIVYPLFCLPVYEHGWMSAGYGVWGKEQWLKEFWSVVDWKKVSDTYSHYRK